MPNVSASQGKQICLSLNCFNENKRIGSQHCKSAQKMSRIACAWPTECRNDITAGSGEEAEEPAEIRDGAIQVHVSQKFI